MALIEFPRLMLAAASSGSGKTTVTCALLRALSLRGRKAASFKCGPDYIDPMFHRESVGVCASSNLDLFFSDENTVRYLLARRAAQAELGVIEGVMGFYDGIALTTKASSYALAAATQTPVVLVVNCRGMSVSIAAQVKGFTEYRPDANIKAVLFNHLSPSLYPELKALIEAECDIFVAGYLPPMQNCSLESRHLGLVTASEVDDLQEKLDALAAQAEKTVEIDSLLKLAALSPPLRYEPPVLPAISGQPKIAVARDRAFCFYYEDSLALLQKLGAQLLFFSPLADEKLPEGANGLLLGGGYPEVYAMQLSENAAMRRAVKAAVENGMPTVAECGGFLYLHTTLQGAQGALYPMAGVFDAAGYPTGKLGRFGYVTLTAREENLLCPPGGQLPAHEFHYWDSTAPGNAFTAQKPQRKTGWDCAVATKTLYAGFPHLYFPGKPDVAVRFLRAAASYAPPKAEGER